MSAAKQYVKLPGRGVRGGVVAATHSSLWLGADHLLQVESTRFSEDYKRFYLADIKAIIVRRTTTWAITNWVLLGITAAVVALFGALAYNSMPYNRGGVVIAGGCIAGFFLFFAAINLLLGPTCVCHLITPVQQEELPSLKRLRAARKALSRIRTAVEAFQGPLTEEGHQEIAKAMSHAAGVPVEAAPLHTGQSPPSLPNHSPQNLRWNVALLVSLVASAVMEAFTIAGFRGLIAIVLLGVANFALGGIAVAMLVRIPHGRSKAYAWTRIATWGFWRGVGGVYGIIAGIQFAIANPGKQADIVKLMEKLPKSYYQAMAVSVGVYLLWAVWEIVLITKARSQPTSQPPPIPAEALASETSD